VLWGCSGRNTKTKGCPLDDGYRSKGGEARPTLAVLKCRRECLSDARTCCMKTVFVFGSNLAGRHGKGDALHARKHHGAVYGQGVGLQGSSYAIPTKDAYLRTLALDEIQRHILDFKTFAVARPDLTFQVTTVGCGLAGYSPADIAPMFEDAPQNCILPDSFTPYLTSDKAKQQRRES
jgi:hypothetical protein